MASLYDLLGRCIDWATGKAKVSAELTGSSFATRLVTSSVNSELSAGASEVLDVYASSGKMSKINALDISIQAPAGAASGTHIIAIYLRNGTTNIGVAYAASNYNVDIELTYSHWRTATAKYPDTSAALMQALSMVAVDSDTHLRFFYLNNTDVATTQTRNIKLNLKERGII
jgi:hypothetical protein